MSLPTYDQPVVHLDEEECWSTLEHHEIGRLAYHLVDEVHVVPVNYAVQEREGRRSLVFLTAEGNKLLAAEMHSDVALEVDDFGTEVGWSVLVRGLLDHLGEVAEDEVDALPLRPWVPTLRYDVIELVPQAITGRRFLLRRG